MLNSTVYGGDIAKRVEHALFHRLGHIAELVDRIVRSVRHVSGSLPIETRSEAVRSLLIGVLTFIDAVLCPFENAVDFVRHHLRFLSKVITRSLDVAGELIRMG